MRSVRTVNSNRRPLHPKIRRRLWLAVLGILSVASQLVTAATPANAVSDQLLRMIQFNVCGNICYGGDIEAGTVVGNEIVSWDARIVTLNEICRNQFDRVLADTGMSGYYFETSGPLSQNRRGVSDCPGDHYGIGLFTDNPFKDASQWWALADPSSNEYRGLICRTTTFLHTVTVCSTHIRPDQVDYQISQVRDHTNVVLTQNYAVVLGGDFNATPGSQALSRIYSSRFSGGYGSFSEVAVNCASPPARCGAPTHSSEKIDYIFFNDTNGAWCCPTAYTRTVGASDHKLLRGTVYLQP